MGEFILLLNWIKRYVFRFVTCWVVTVLAEHPGGVVVLDSRGLIIMSN